MHAVVALALYWTPAAPAANFAVTHTRLGPDGSPVHALLVTGADTASGMRYNSLAIFTTELGVEVALNPSAEDMARHDVPQLPGHRFRGWGADFAVWTKLDLSFQVWQQPTNRIERIARLVTAHPYAFWNAAEDHWRNNHLADLLSWVRKLSDDTSPLQDGPKNRMSSTLRRMVPDSSVRSPNTAAATVTLAVVQRALLDEIERPGPVPLEGLPRPAQLDAGSALYRAVMSLEASQWPPPPPPPAPPLVPAPPPPQPALPLVRPSSPPPPAPPPVQPIADGPIPAGATSAVRSVSAVEDLGPAMEQELREFKQLMMREATPSQRRELERNHWRDNYPLWRAQCRQSTPLGVFARVLAHIEREHERHRQVAHGRHLAEESRRREPYRRFMEQVRSGIRRGGR